MTLEKLFEIFPSKMTARDLNKKNGKYKKLPFIPFAGDLSNNCYIRRTKNGFVLYTINGYIQPIFIKANGNEITIQKDKEMYIKTILKYLSYEKR